MIMACLGSELVYDNEEGDFHEKEEGSEEELDEYEIAHDPKKMFELIHSKEHFFTDCYLLFERIMDLGIKELYYRDISEEI